MLWEVPQRCRGAGLSSREQPVPDLSLASVEVRPGPLGTGDSGLLDGLDSYLPRDYVQSPRKFGHRRPPGASLQGLALGGHEIGLKERVGRGCGSHPCHLPAAGPGTGTFPRCLGGLSCEMMPSRSSLCRLREAWGCERSRGARALCCLSLGAGLRGHRTTSRPTRRAAGAWTPRPRLLPFSWFFRTNIVFSVKMVLQAFFFFKHKNSTS